MTNSQDKYIWAVSGNHVQKNCLKPMNIDEATLYVISYYIPSGGGGAYKSEGFYCNDELIWNEFIKNCSQYHIQTQKICRITSFYPPKESKIDTKCCIIS